MEETKVVLNENNSGEIQLYSGGTKAGKMDVSVKDGVLVIYHTEVGDAFGGRGFANILLEKAASHARENGLKIDPLCPYVHTQFKRRPDEYQDIWHKRKV